MRDSSFFAFDDSICPKDIYIYIYMCVEREYLVRIGKRTERGEMEISSRSRFICRAIVIIIQGSVSPGAKRIAIVSRSRYASRRGIDNLLNRSLYNISGISRCSGLTKFMRNLVPLSSLTYVRTYVRVLILEDGGGGRGGREGEHVPGRAALEIKRTLSLAHVISGHGRS